MDNETLIDAIAAAVLAKIGQSTINQELDMIRTEMTAIHNRILTLTNRVETGEIDISRLEMRVDEAGSSMSQEDVADIVRDSLSDILSGASLSIDI
jgi:hypothetical protein